MAEWIVVIILGLYVLAAIAEYLVANLDLRWLQIVPFVLLSGALLLGIVAAYVAEEPILGLLSSFVTFYVWLLVKERR